MTLVSQNEKKKLVYVQSVAILLHTPTYIPPPKQYLVSSDLTGGPLINDWGRGDAKNRRAMDELESVIV